MGFMRDFEVGGLNLNLFESPELEQEQPDYPEENARIIARNMLRFLMMKYQGNWREIFSPQLLQAVLIKSDSSLLRGMRYAFQEGFQHVWLQLENQTLSTRQNNQAELFISNCLCILPFADLKLGHAFKIPQLMDGRWQLVTYNVRPIELTPTRGFETLFMYDEDRVFAYGLEPVDQPHAEPQLIFMGTTYPAGQGFASQINTDLEGFETVGNSLYRTGHERIIAWLDKQKKQVHVCGASLGGALALLLAMHHGEKLSRVDALNPPGLYDSWIKSIFDRWDSLNKKPNVFIQKQGNDFVSSLGIWKEDWNILKVIPVEAAFISALDHARNYAGYVDTIFEIIDAKKDNEARRVQNLLLYSLARGAAYYFGILPYHYVMRPVLRYIYDYMAQLALFGLVLACIIPLIPLNLALLAVVAPVVAHVVSKFVASADVWMGFTDLPQAKLHVCESEENSLSFD